MTEPSNYRYAMEYMGSEIYVPVPPPLQFRPVDENKIPLDEPRVIIYKFVGIEKEHVFHYRGCVAIKDAYVYQRKGMEYEP